VSPANLSRQIPTHVERTSALPLRHGRKSGAGIPAEANQVQAVPTQQETLICVLDDDASVLKAMRRLLRSAGLQVMAFQEAGTFLEHAETHAISLAILDIWMPGINGLEVQRRLLEIAPATPVIVMTGRDAPAMRSLAVAQGAAAFFAKPFEDEALLRAIRAALPAAT
jgi:FixJ family two-component response regulator